MPRRDTYHNGVRNALVKDGWTITHDPYTLPFGLHNLYVIPGAERLIAAEREADRIAVKIKDFASPSEVEDLEEALGQYLVYRTLLKRYELDRVLYLAVSDDAWDGVLNTDLGKVIREDYPIRLIVFDPDDEVVEQWLT